MPQVLLIQTCYFQLTTSRRFYSFCHFNYTIGIKIKTDYGIIRIGIFRFFYKVQNYTRTIKFSYSISFRITHPIAKYCSYISLFCIFYGLLQHWCQPLTIKYIIAENQTDRIFLYKLLSNDKSLCQAIGRGLFCVFYINPIIRPISQ